MDSLTISDSQRELSHNQGLQMIDALHMAYADGTRWSDFLRVLAQATGARHAVMMALEADPASPVLASHGLSRVAAGQWHAYYRRVDPWLNAMTLPAPGQYRMIEGESLVPDQALRELKVYSDYLAPNDLRWLRGFWLHPDCDASVPYGVLLWRGVDQPSFAANALATLDTVARAILALEQVGIANAQSRACGLDGHDKAVFLLDSQGRLIMANARGDVLLRSRALSLERGKPQLSNASAQRWLETLIEQSPADPHLLAATVRCRESLTDVGQAQLELTATRPIGAPPSLLNLHYSLAIREVAEGRDPAVRRTAQKVYRWTNAEFDSVVKLAAGESLPEIARHRQSTIETVRSHLKNAKRKAGVHRQVDLVRIMTSLER